MTKKAVVGLATWAMALTSIACDVVDPDSDRSFPDSQRPEAALEDHELGEAVALHWERPPWSDEALGADGLSRRRLPPRGVETLGLPWTLESLFFRTGADFIALTSAPGGLFPPLPADIALLDDPGLENGFMLATKFRDGEGAVVGFGTEQEVLDLENALVATTYTITLPGRGTLMAEQIEDVSPLLDEIDDMILTGELVRSYEPPLTVVNTVPGTGRIVGGTDEFDHAFGFIREVGSIYSIDLTQQQLDLGVELQVLRIP